jgi:hypothetical protein
MPARKQTPSKIKHEEHVSDETEQTPEEQVAAPIVIETERLSQWQTITDMSDNLLIVQCCNFIDKTGMGRRNCLMRQLDAETGKLSGVPTVMKGFIVVNGDLQGE